MASVTPGALGKLVAALSRYRRRGDISWLAFSARLRPMTGPTASYLRDTRPAGKGAEFGKMLRPARNRESGLGVPVLTATAPQAERPAASFVSLFTVHASLYTPRHDGVSAGGVGDWSGGRGVLAARAPDGAKGEEEDG